MPALQGAAKEFLVKLPIFTGLPEADVKAISDNSEIRHYRKNQHIYYHGDDANRMVVIKNGWVRLYRTHIDGDETTAGLLTGGESLGERAVFPLNRKQTLSAQAIEDSATVEISGAVLRERIEHNPEIMRRIAQMLVQRMNRLYIENEHLSHMSAPQRAACLLLRLSSKMHGNGGTFSIPFDKALAAAQLGMKRETFSRALARLKPYGVHINGYEITIDNFVRLSEYSCLQCSMEKDECDGRRCGSCPVKHGPARMRFGDSESQLSLDLMPVRYARAS